jgi:hypothetical protein
MAVTWRSRANLDRAPESRSTCLSPAQKQKRNVNVMLASSMRRSERVQVGGDFAFEA